MKYLITNAADNFPCMLQYFLITYWTIIHYHMASCQITQSIRSTVSALDLDIWLDIYMLLNWVQVKTNKWNKITYVIWIMGTQSLVNDSTIDGHWRQVWQHISNHVGNYRLRQSIMQFIRISEDLSRVVNINLFRIMAWLQMNSSYIWI